MTPPEIAPLHDDLTFHGPLSEERAARLIRSLLPLDNAHVLDLGCGWAELLLRPLEAAPTATGTGVDLNPADTAKATAGRPRDAGGMRVGRVDGTEPGWSKARPGKGRASQRKGEAEPLPTPLQACQLFTTTRGGVVLSRVVPQLLPRRLGRGL
ncbi:SAM-dependent methyltransferase [Lentzea jiangxiensis]|uniref:Methyltransferase domain-containing protein n=1 Tax=Lentzea jiangxiensis TaxID=641025 RepID=A0A1H0GCY4_9PSEU|nr:class I SAM-dependent methyltransferase [Lentzea jiangxiensis]SDO04698.1 hypothetical protein SAMN05421507_1011157 [Lentzea jiangxiensis]